MSKGVTEVLNHQQVKQRITRIAWQIFENHQDETLLILAGIAERGFLLAKMIAAELKQISELEVSLHKILLDKKNPLSSTPTLKPEAAELNNQCIVVVDDVLNSGTTLIYGVKYFLEYAVKQIHTVVLVDRNHKSYPVKADFKGLSLSTSIKEHVEVKIEEEPYSVTVS